MDFNDLKTRLDRTLSSLNLRFEESIDENISFKTSFIENENYVEKHVTMVFGNDSEEETLNKILIILHNLSNLKDHLKNCLKTKGLDPNIVETKINSSVQLQVLIDLVNQEKHGYPLTKTKRSNKDPLIKNVSQVLRMTNNNPTLLDSGEIDFSNPNNFISFSPDGKINSLGDNKIVISADIFDGFGNKLFDIDELVDNSYKAFEEIIKEYDLIS